MPDKIFTFKHTVYFNETNAVSGVVYFSHYVKWQGMAREEFLIRMVPEWKQVMEASAKGKIDMITAEEHSKFMKHSFFGDEILIKSHVREIKKFSFEIVFEMTKNGSKDHIYEGWHRLAYSDFDGNFVQIPEPVLRAILEYAPQEEIKRYKQRYQTTKEGLVTR